MNPDAERLYDSFVQERKEKWIYIELLEKIAGRELVKIAKDPEYVEYFKRLRNLSPFARLVNDVSGRNMNPDELAGSWDLDSTNDNDKHY